MMKSRKIKPTEAQKASAVTIDMRWPAEVVKATIDAAARARPKSEEGIWFYVVSKGDVLDLPTAPA